MLLTDFDPKLDTCAFIKKGSKQKTKTNIFILMYDLTTNISYCKQKKKVLSMAFEQLFYSGARLVKSSGRRASMLLQQLPQNNTRAYRHIKTVFGAKLRNLYAGIAQGQHIVVHSIYFVAKNKDPFFGFCYFKIF